MSKYRVATAKSQSQVRGRVGQESNSPRKTCESGSMVMTIYLLMYHLQKDDPWVGVKGEIGSGNGNRTEEVPKASTRWNGAESKLSG